MKKTLTVCLLGIIICLFISSQALASSPINVDLPNATIIIDGNPDDWNGIQPVMIDAKGDSNCGIGTDLSNLYLAKDSENVYWRVDSWDNFFSDDIFSEGRIEIVFRQGQQGTSSIEGDILSRVYKDRDPWIAIMDNSDNWNRILFGSEYGYVGSIIEGKIPVGSFKSSAIYNKIYVHNKISEHCDNVVYDLTNPASGSISVSPVSVNLTSGETGSVNISGGTGYYTSAESSDENIATASSQSSNIVSIFGLSSGTATVTVTDSSGATALISVSVANQTINKTIQVDGYANDWINIKPYMTDPQYDTQCNDDTDIKAFYVTTDSNFLYWRIDTWSGKYGFYGHDSRWVVKFLPKDFQYSDLRDTNKTTGFLENIVWAEHKKGTIWYHYNHNEKHNERLDGVEYGTYNDVVEGKIPLHLFDGYNYTEIILEYKHFQSAKSTTCDYISIKGNDLINQIKPDPDPDSLTLDIKANGSDGPVTISEGDPLSITLSLDPGGYGGLNADWWIALLDSSGNWQSFVNSTFPGNWTAGHDDWTSGLVRSFTSPLKNLQDVQISVPRMPPGQNFVALAIDDNDDGKLDVTWLDFVQIDVNSAPNQEHEAYASFIDNEFFDIVAVHESGENIFIELEGNNLRSMVYTSVEGNSATIIYGSNGLPSRIVDGEYTFVFKNYESGTVDMALIYPDESIDIFKNVAMDFSSIRDIQNGSLAVRSSRSNDSELSLNDLVNIGLFTASVAGCGILVALSAPTVIGSLAIAAACGGALLTGVSITTENQIATGSNIALGTFLCATFPANPVGGAKDCLTTGITVVNEIWSVDQQKIQDDDSIIHQAESKLQFLSAEESNVTLQTGESRTVSISGGTGYYTVGSNNAWVATAELKGSVLQYVEITGLAAGNATITIEDSSLKTVTISVTVNSVNPPPSGDCGAYVAPDVWKEFDCYNLAAIGKTTGDDPFTPSWRLIGGYWQWGRKGPSSSEWYNTNTKHFAHGPTGPDSGDANDGSISGWNSLYDTSYPDWGSCPSGLRVPTKSQWDGVDDNNTQSTVGSWSSSATNYSSARFFGSDLMLPAAGYRSSLSGALNNRGYRGYYWSRSQHSIRRNFAWPLTFGNEDVNLSDFNFHRYGFSVRCIAE